MLADWNVQVVQEGDTGPDVGRRDVWQARVIVRWAPDAAEKVIAGGEYFKHAFEQADKRRKAAEIVEEQMKRLRAAAAITPCPAHGGGIEKRRPRTRAPSSSLHDTAIMTCLYDKAMMTCTAN